mmetsp:Transcript_64451/g.76334  ORF Transcript_64451/g.76334 Transcript_64451/m.76334 type:complete len:100 (+) Transcript_64451:896-1195(+)
MVYNCSISDITCYNTRERCLEHCTAIILLENIGDFQQGVLLLQVVVLESSIAMSLRRERKRCDCGRRWWRGGQGRDNHGVGGETERCAFGGGMWSSKGG